MIGNGWEEEVISLYKKDPSVINTNAFKAIGYLTIINNYLNNEKTDIALITKKTCQYAKRQITWIKNRFCNAYVSIDFEQTLEKIKTFLSN
jgi:tRNA dimethylallyltransferase